MRITHWRYRVLSVDDGNEPDQVEIEGSTHMKACELLPSSPVASARLMERPLSILRDFISGRMKKVKVTLSPETEEGLVTLLEPWVDCSWW